MESRKEAIRREKEAERKEFEVTNATFLHKSIFSDFLEKVEHILEDEPNTPAKLTITTGYLNLSDWLRKIAGMLEEYSNFEVEILLGKEPTANHDNEIQKKQQDILLPYTETLDAESYRYAQLLSRIFEAEEVKNRLSFFLPKVDAPFLHAKTALLELNAIPLLGVVGSMNLTHAGDYSNLEAAVLTIEEPVLFQHKEWLKSLKVENADEKISAAYEHMAKYQKVDDVYYTILHNLYGGLTKQEATPYDSVHWLTGLYPHQKDGGMAAWNILQKYNGVFLGDEVGLGKTYTAISLVRKVSLSRKRTLIVVPTVLKKTWEQALKDTEVHDYYDLIAYNEIQTLLDDNRDNYLSTFELIIFDEAHWLRNVQLGKEKVSQRSLAVEELVFRTGAKIALLTATPINNMLKDLGNQLSLFIHDDILREEGFPSLKAELKKLDDNPDAIEKSKVFTILLSKVAVIRTRKLVRSKYADHPEMKFPTEVKFERIEYKLSKNLEGLIEEVIRELETDSGTLKLSAYRPSLFAIDDDPKTRQSRGGELRNNALIRLNLMKRLDSSLPAFIASLETLLKKTNSVVEVVEKALDDPSYNNTSIITSEPLDENIKFEDIDEEETLTVDVERKASPEELFLTNLDKEKYFNSLKSEKVLLSKWLEVARMIHENEEDYKLEKLVSILYEKIDDKFRGILETRKTIIFTTDMVTADYLQEKLYSKLEKYALGKSPTKTKLAITHGFTNEHIAKITGTVNAKNKEAILADFAPEFNSGKSVGQGSIDVLITTDVLAEGANLQNSDLVIHYNLPWNPVKAIQRVGRIDRLKSNHKTVYSSCFFPGAFIEQFLNLNSIIAPKLLKARHATGTNTKGVDGKEGVEKFFEMIEGSSVETLEEYDSIEDISPYTEEKYIAKFEQLLTANNRRLPVGSGALVRGNFDDKLVVCVRIPTKTGKSKRTTFYELVQGREGIKELSPTTVLSELTALLQSVGKNDLVENTLIPFETSLVDNLFSFYNQICERWIEGRIVKEQNGSLPAEIQKKLEVALAIKLSSKIDQPYEEYVSEAIRGNYTAVLESQLKNQIKNNVTPRTLIDFFVKALSNEHKDLELENNKTQQWTEKDIEVITWIQYQRKNENIEVVDFEVSKQHVEFSIIDNLIENKISPNLSFFRNPKERHTVELEAVECPKQLVFYIPSNELPTNEKMKVNNLLPTRGKLRLSKVKIRKR